MDDINELVRRGKTAVIYDYTGAESELPKLLADTIEALAASVDRANAANEALCADVEAQAAELARLKSRLRMIVSHATMGSTDGEGQSTNDICVRITDLRNELYQDAKAAALTQTTGD